LENIYRIWLSSCTAKSLNLNNYGRFYYIRLFPIYSSTERTSSIGSGCGKYKPGMTVTATCESVLTHVTVTVEIWRDGVKWKDQTVLGSSNYTDVTVAGTL